MFDIKKNYLLGGAILAPHIIKFWVVPFTKDMRYQERVKKNLLFKIQQLLYQHSMIFRKPSPTHVGIALQSGGFCQWKPSVISLVCNNEENFTLIERNWD